MEIERLKKELKQSKKTPAPVTSAENDPEEIECTISHLHIPNLIVSDFNLAVPPPLQPVTADTSVLMDELMAGTRRNNKKQHVSHSNSRESQVRLTFLSLDQTFQSSSLNF